MKAISMSRIQGGLSARVATKAMVVMLLAVMSGPALGQVVTVRATGEGLSAKDAERAALTQALEQAAGLEIGSFSEVQDFELIRDRIFSRAVGTIADFTVLDTQRQADGTFRVTVSAKVNPADIMQLSWVEVRNQLSLSGNPKILVLIDERIDGQLQPDSIVQTRLMQMFAERGFDLVSAAGVNRLKTRLSEAAGIQGNVERVAELAKRENAQVIIQGTSNANFAELKRIGGVSLAMYNCDVAAEAYWTDTGDLISAESIPAGRSGAQADRRSPQAARKALVKTTFPDPDEVRVTAVPLADRLVRSIIKRWVSESTGGGLIELEVRDVDFGAYMEIKRKLEEVGEITDVNAEFGDRIAQFRLSTKLNGQQLAELLFGRGIGDYIEINNVKARRIEAKNRG